MTSQPMRRMLLRLSEVSSESALAGHVAEFVAVVGHPNFPCTYATRALARDELLFSAVSPATEPLSAAAAVLHELTGLVAEDPDAVAVLFLPGTASLSADRRFVQDLIHYLCEHDDVGWPWHEPTDPEDPAWMLWYGGVGLFLNISSNNHLLRRSRNLGSSLTVIAQARSSFDRYPGNTGVRARIRKRVAAYDDVAVHSALGCFGDESNRESHQYFLGDSAHDEPSLARGRIIDAVRRRHERILGAHSRDPQ